MRIGVIPKELTLSLRESQSEKVEIYQVSVSFARPKQLSIVAGFFQYEQSLIPSTTAASVRTFAALTYPFNTLTLLFQATSHNPTILHHPVWVLV